MRRFILYGIPKSFLIKIIIALLIILGCKNVFAEEVNVTNNCYGSTGYSGMYNGQEVQYQTYNPYNFGTTYQYQLSSFETELRYNFSADTDYILTINTNNSNDFRNNFKTYNVYDLDNNDNNLVSSFTFVSMKKVQIAFKTTTATSRVQIQMGGSNNYDNITGETNWNIKSVVLTIPESAPSGSTNQDIIDNQTNNTNNIINNNNQNTSNIINNNNQNTDTITNSITEGANSIKESLANLCENLFDKNKYGFDDYGKLFFDLSNLQIGKTYTISTNQPIYIYKFSSYNNVDAGQGVGPETWTNGIYSWTFTYDGNSRLFINSRELSTDFDSSISQVSNINFMLVEGSNSKAYCVFGSTSSKLDDTTSAINDVNNSINNSNVDSGTGSDFFNDFSSEDNGGISGIITKPLVLINSLLSNNSSCNNLTFGIKFPNMENKNVSLPSGCILWNNVPNNVVSIYHIFIVGFCSYYLLKRLFKDVEDLKNPEKDNVEVIDL